MQWCSFRRQAVSLRGKVVSAPIRLRVRGDDRFPPPSPPDCRYRLQKVACSPLGAVWPKVCSAFERAEIPRRAWFRLPGGTRHMDSKSEQTGNVERPGRCEEGVETAKRLAQRMLGLDSSALRRSAGEMAELHAVVGSDYRSLAALPSAAAARELAGLVASEIHPLHECWKGRRVRFRVKRPAPAARRSRSTRPRTPPERASDCGGFPAR